MTRRTLPKHPDHRLFAKAFGKVIRHVRKQRGMSGWALAKALGVHQQAVSKWELGQQIPSASVMLYLAGALDFPLSRLCAAAESAMEVMRASQGPRQG